MVKRRTIVKTGKIDLRNIFLGLQRQMIEELSTGRKNILNPTTKGDVSEAKWVKLLNTYLPKRYKAEKAFILDSKGNLSQQIDLVIFDQQYSPFLFNQDGAIYVPAESVYAVFEVKQILNKQNIAYAGEKAGSVRKLIRTSAPIPYVRGVYRPKRLPRIIAGILSLDCSWKPPFGTAFMSSLKALSKLQELDLGCVLREGAFDMKYGRQGRFSVQKSTQGNSLIFFFLRLLERLRLQATVPAMDLSKYARAVEL